jgi:hypothetical protein
MGLLIGVPKFSLIQQILLNYGNKHENVDILKS